jgi:type IV pilus assembly protein PilV
MLRRQRGFSLIEVLITLFVFAIGILTVAGLQIIAKKSNFDALQRTTASFLANDILERMRANLSENGDYLDSYLVESLGDDGDGMTAPGTDCTATSCTPEQMAAWDLWEWRQSLLGVAEDSTGGLVEPTACIRSETTTGGAAIYHVIIAWRGVSPTGNPSADAALVPDFPDGCGTETDNFTDDDTGAANVYRRLIVVSAFITP